MVISLQNGGQWLVALLYHISQKCPHFSCLPPQGWRCDGKRGLANKQYAKNKAVLLCFCCYRAAVFLGYFPDII